MACIRELYELKAHYCDADDYRSHAGYTHMGMIWSEAIKHASQDALITPPVFNQTP